MDTHSQRTQADHRPYIELVRLALLVKDVHVGVPVFKPGRIRSAEMTLLPPDEDFDDAWHFTFASADRVQLRWDEEAGWSVPASYTAGESVGPTIWRYGFGVLLPPDEIAAWVDLLLTSPNAAISREDGPYRSHQKPDRAFEALLASYTL